MVSRNSKKALDKEDIYMLHSTTYKCSQYATLHQEKHLDFTLSGLQTDEFGLKNTTSKATVNYPAVR